MNIYSGGNEMKQLYKNLLFGAFGISCKLSFHVIALVVSFVHAPKIGWLLVGIWIIHNIVSLWFAKGKKFKCTLE